MGRRSRIRIEKGTDLARLPLRTLYARAFRLRCPRCGGGRLFAGWFKMFPTCANCKLRYERAPGYFLGSAYINYGVTSVLLTIAYIVLHFGAGYTNRTLAAPLAGFCVLFPLITFRHARAFWLAMDCFFDSASFEVDQD